MVKQGFSIENIQAKFTLFSTHTNWVYQSLLNLLQIIAKVSLLLHTVVTLLAYSIGKKEGKFKLMNTTLPKALNEKPNTENTPMNQQKMKQEKSEISNQTKQCLIALYCGSRFGHNPIYREKAIALAENIAKHGMGIVYGGASIGLMGQVADSVIGQGVEVVGVIPEFMLDYEIAHSKLTELHVVKTMHERKAMMAERASAFVALPGGLGTFEEILEVATWGQLNQHQKPMIIYNVNGFYDALIAQLDHAVTEGFLPPQHRAKVIVCNHSEQILNALANLEAPKNFVM